MGEMKTPSFFAADYQEARRKLLTACARAELTVRSYRHPSTGPDGSPLYTDTIWIGPHDARSVLVTLSATHGVEGFCGSGCQVGFLESGRFRQLPAGTAVLLVHAINPYGFAWVRRVNEDNVDLNRNFVDHDKARPENPRFAELYPALCPDRWDPEAIARSSAELALFADRHGMSALQEVASRGQYTHPQGIFFGGTRPTWSNKTMREILQRHARGREKVALVDFHTGLGPYGVAELITFHPRGSKDYDRATAWYGKVTDPAAGESVSANLEGVIEHAFLQELSGTEVITVTAEYGTVELFEVLQSLRADNWLHAHGDPSSPQGKEIKAQIRRAFYPDEDDWKQMVYERSVDVMDRALAGLSA
jgi:hypothetical protein